MALVGRHRCTREQVLWLTLVLTASCGSSVTPTRVCNVDADCASGVCLPNGTCQTVNPPGDPLSHPDGQQTGDPDSGDPSPGDPPAGDPSAGDPATTGCHPNYDGTITAAELPLGPDNEAMFRISNDVIGFNTAPDCSSGTCTWDLVNVGGTTEEVLTGTTAPSEHWFANEPAFANATYVAEIGQFTIPWVCDQMQLGVFEKNGTGVYLLGIASALPEDMTLLTNDPPVPVLKLPLSLSDTWTVDTTATGPLCGSVFDYAIDQTYETTVDLTGTVTTPYGTFDNVLRVNTLMTRHLGYGVTYTTVRTHALVTECHTTIATIVSEELETDADFNDPFEVKRLSTIQ